MRIYFPTHKTYWPLWLFISATILLAGMIYWPGFYGPFILDDLQSLEPAQMAHFSWRKLFFISMQNDSGPLGRPLAVISFALNNYFFGLTPFSFKLINFILHLGIGLIGGIFIYQLMLVQPRKKSLALPVTCLASLLWIIHPLQVTTVLYAVQRMTQLCHGFILLGLTTYLWGRIRWLAHKPRGVSLMLTSFLFFPLALLSKETGILMPWYFFCVEYFILRFHCRHASQQKVLTSIHLFLSIGTLIALVIYYFYSLPKFMAFFAEKESTPFLRFLTELKVLMLYLKMILLPQISQMGFYHDDFALVKGLDSAAILTGGFFLFLLVLILKFKRKVPIIAFGGAWFFVSHLLESTFLPLELVFEHRNYLAILGLMWIPAYYIVYLSKKLTKTKSYLIAGSTLCFVGVLASLTFLRSENWSNSDKILFAAKIYHPHSPRVHIELANYLLMKEQYSEALTELNEAQRLQPNNLGIALHKMLIHCHAQQLSPELYKEIANNIQQKPLTPYAIVALDTLVLNLYNEKCTSIEAQKIISLLHQAQQNPFLTYHPRYQATLYQLEAALQLQQEQLDLSLALLLKAYHTYPKSFDPLIQKAKIELLKGRHQQAQATLHYLQQQIPAYFSLDKVVQLEKEITKEITQAHSLNNFESPFLSKE